MRMRLWWVLAAVLCLIGHQAHAARPQWAADDGQPSPAVAVPALLPDEAAMVAALDPWPQLDGKPILADDVVSDESIYAVPPPTPEEERINNGGVHLDLDLFYSDKYVYRGVNHDDVVAHGNSLNLLIDGKMTFDFGKYPHPFVGVFTNIFDADPLSRFQEIRPYVGLDWNLRPFLLEVGNITYIYPQREDFDQNEAYGKITIDDSLLFGTDQPILSPYVLGAYEYQKNQGWYLEAGIKHDFPIRDLDLVLTVQADVGYIFRLREQFVFVNDVQDTGWQHAEVGMSASYSLNTLLNFSRRYGEFSLKGYMFYSDRLSRNITANDIFWGGGGIGFKY